MRSSENAGRFVHLDLSAARDESNEAAGVEMSMRCTALVEARQEEEGARNPYEYYYTVASTSVWWQQ